MESVSVSLGSEVISATGSINGEAVVFIMTYPQVWSAEVARDSGGRYDIYIDTVNGFGIITSFHIVVYQFIGWTPPVYDRLQWDVDSGNSKGFLNYHDLNRIESNCKFLADTLRSYGYKITLVTKTDWERTDFPYTTELERITANIGLILSGFYSLPSTPALPTGLGVMYYYKLNDIEKVLFDIKSVFDSMIQSVRYSGMFFSGGAHYGIGNS